jgi:lysozyme family protein
VDTNKLIYEIIEREGGFVNNPHDKGGATNFGITAATLGKWRKLGRNATVEEVRNLKKPEASDIYYHEYCLKPGFDKIPDPHLQAQLVDYGVNSGPMLAIHKLQEIVGAESDGVLGSETLSKLALKDARVVNNLLVAERVKMFCRIVIKAKSQIAFLNGWVNRALSFLR